MLSVQRFLRHLVQRNKSGWLGMILVAASLGLPALTAQTGVSVGFARAAEGHSIALVEHGQAAPVVVENTSPGTLKVVAKVFAGDTAKVTGAQPNVLSALPARPPRMLVLVGVVGHSPLLDKLASEGKLPLASLRGQWENALTAVVENPFPGVKRALVIAGSDRRGAAFALFTLSRRMGVSPWWWWADVPVPHHEAVYISGAIERQNTPSVQYRGIFLNDEDWGLRPWAARKMDPAVGNIGPHTYEHVFELLLRLHANSLWPAMHPGTTAFNAIPENAKLADHWGIVMGSSHSEALLRNNVGEWDETRDGPWNYQVNRSAIDAYWNKRVMENGGYENFYTVGMRGVHDTGLEATGTAEEKARLVEEVMKAQRGMLAAHVNAEVAAVPQVIWLYKESLELYRAGMRVPDDVTLGWTDDNFGYIRQLPNGDEQKRQGGSGLYYHVSYWGRPHDYLWLCTTPPALMREELTKAYDHQTRRYWVLNVGDLKPAESDIDYFMQLAWNEPTMAKVDQQTFLERWLGEQFPSADAKALADIMGRYYRLNFIRKPEHMGFNGYDDEVKRTAFNPLAWGDQNGERLDAFRKLASDAVRLGSILPAASRDAFFELVGYPVQASFEQNVKLLETDRGFLAASQGLDPSGDAEKARAAFARIGELTAHYNEMLGGKWDGMMSANPRERHVFAMPKQAAAADRSIPLPPSWGAGSAQETATGTGFVEKNGVVSINAAHFDKKVDGLLASWSVMPELGISPGGTVEYGRPGILAEQPAASVPAADAPYLEYSFTTADGLAAELAVSLLPTFPLDSLHRLRFAVALDGGLPRVLDLSGAGEWKDDGQAPAWEENVLRNEAILHLSLGVLGAGRHSVRLMYLDPGVVFEQLVITRPHTAPAYPVPPETVGR